MMWRSGSFLSTVYIPSIQTISCLLTGKADTISMPWGPGGLLGVKTTALGKENHQQRQVIR